MSEDREHTWIGHEGYVPEMNQQDDIERRGYVPETTPWTPEQPSSPSPEPPSSDRADPQPAPQGPSTDEDDQSLWLPWASNNVV
jgi:hypothetical protein